MANKDKQKEYNDEPVIYCPKCYSLNIIEDSVIGISYCKECGCTDFKETTIEEWESMYRERYGHKLVTKSEDLTKSPIYNMSRHRLMNMLFEMEDSDIIIFKMFPLAPKEMSRKERIMWAFAKIDTQDTIHAIALIIIKHLRQIK